MGLESLPKSSHEALVFHPYLLTPQTPYSLLHPLPSPPKKTTGFPPQSNRRTVAAQWRNTVRRPIGLYWSDSVCWHHSLKEPRLEQQIEDRLAAVGLFGDFLAGCYILGRKMGGLQFLEATHINFKAKFEWQKHMGETLIEIWISCL